MTNVSPWIICTITFSQFASLYGTVHCPFSHRDVVQTSPVHPNPMIWYALSHISLIISSSKQPPYLPIMAFPWPFRDIFPCNFHRFRLMTWAFIVILLCMIVRQLAWCFHGLSVFWCLCYAKSLHIPVHRRRHSYRVILCHRYWVVNFISFEL